MFLASNIVIVLIRPFLEWQAVDASAIGPIRELEKLLDSPENSEVMRGWRAELLGEKIAAIVTAA